MNKKKQKNFFNLGRCMGNGVASRHRPRVTKVFAPLFFKKRLLFFFFFFLFQKLGGLLALTSTQGSVPGLRKRCGMSERK